MLTGMYSMTEWMAAGIDIIDLCFLHFSPLFISLFLFNVILLAHTFYLFVNEFIHFYIS